MQLTEAPNFWRIHAIPGMEKPVDGERYDPTSPIGSARLKGWYVGQQIVQERFVKKAEETNETEAIKKTKNGETVQ